MRLNLILSFPNLKVLGPNSRVDRRSKQHKDARRNMKNEAFYETKRAMGREKFENAYLHLTMVFHEPDHRRRDMDNMQGAMKYAQDGIALALGVDDYEFSNTYVRGWDRSAPGFVTVEIRQQDDATQLVPVVGTVAGERIVRDD